VDSVDCDPEKEPVEARSGWFEKSRITITVLRPQIESTISSPQTYHEVLDENEGNSTTQLEP